MLSLKTILFAIALSRVSERVRGSEPVYGIFRNSSRAGI